MRRVHLVRFLLDVAVRRNSLPVLGLSNLDDLTDRFGKNLYENACAGRYAHKAWCVLVFFK